jgi:hypothetical protein
MDDDIRQAIPQQFLVAHRQLLDECRPRILEHIEEARRRYEHSHNPVWVHLAYLECRFWACEIPEWILKKFDDFARGVERLAMSTSRAMENGDTADAEWKAAIVETVGFRSSSDARGGQQNPFREWVRMFLAETLATRVRVLVDGEAVPESKAIMIVALALNQPESNVRRAWKNFAPLVRLGELTRQQSEIVAEDEAKKRH